MRLRKLVLSDERAFCDMRAEFLEAGGAVNPGFLRSYNGDFAALLAGEKPGKVPGDFYALEDDTGELLGACAVRRYLTEELLQHAGHIGYGIRPARRGEGLGAVQLRLALVKAREVGIARALVTCDEDNIASRRVIEKCGGAYEDARPDDEGGMVRRYWFDTANPVSVRRARSGDEGRLRPLQAEIALLHYEGEPEYFRPEPIEYVPGAFADVDRRAFLAEDERGDTVGCAVARVVRVRNHPTRQDRDVFHVEELCVLRRAQRRGIGRGLLAECEREAKKLGCRDLELSVHAFNRNAVAFYESEGFRPQKIVMERAL